MAVPQRYEEFLEQLPDSITWKEGRAALGISDSTMSRFIKTVIKASLLVKGTDGVYRKVEVRK
jgi:hypothetical protein